MSKESDLAGVVREKAQGHGVDLPWFAAKEIAREMLALGAIEVVQKAAPPIVTVVPVLPPCQDETHAEKLNTKYEQFKKLYGKEQFKDYFDGGAPAKPKVQGWAGTVVSNGANADAISNVSISSISASNIIASNFAPSTKLSVGQGKKVKIVIDGLACLGVVEINPEYGEEKISDYSAIVSNAPTTWTMKVTDVEWATAGYKGPMKTFDLPGPLASVVGDQKVSTKVMIAPMYGYSQKQLKAHVKTVANALDMELYQKLHHLQMRRTTHVVYHLDWEVTQQAWRLEAECLAAKEGPDGLNEVAEKFIYSSKDPFPPF